MTTNDKIIIGVLVAGAAGYVGWKIYQSRQGLLPGSGEEDEEVNKPPTWHPVDFPLRIGSRGDKVKELQKALIKKGGKIAAHIVSTGGADGKWGSGTQKAVEVAKWPSAINQLEFNRLVSGQGPIMPPSIPGDEKKTASSGRDLSSFLTIFSGN